MAAKKSKTVPSVEVDYIVDNEEEDKSIPQAILMRKRNLCDTCIMAIVDKLSIDEILILRYLKKENTINNNLSKDKTQIIPEIKGMTEHKFQFSISVLEVCNFVGRNNTKRPNRFYITKDGIRAIYLYELMIKEELMNTTGE